MDIQLKLVNQSNEQANPQIVIFQKNVEAMFDEIAVAWKVVNNLGINEWHPFLFPNALDVVVGDSDGNYSPPMPCALGQGYDYVPSDAGNCLVQAGATASPTEVEVRNKLETGAISIDILRGGKLLARQTSVAPDQEALFSFGPTLWIGAVANCTEGQVMAPAVIADVNTELSLVGLASADIVMRGGGPGPDATPLSFTLQNQVFV